MKLFKSLRSNVGAIFSSFKSFNGVSPTAWQKNIRLPTYPMKHGFVFAFIIVMTNTAQANPSIFQEGEVMQNSTSEVAEPYAKWSERGRLVSYKYQRTLSRNDIRSAMFDLPFADSYASFGLEDFFDFYSYSDISSVTKYRVDVYQVIYETVDPWGVPTTASGAVLVPQASRWQELPTPALLSLQRGTVFYDADVPSHGNMPDWGIWRGLLPASAGYITAMPDLLGFGAAKHMVHPYLVADSSAHATIDMLRAVRQLAETLHWPMREEVFLAGLSQGGRVTLATQREIEANHADEFILAGSAPASGAYFLSAVINSLLNSDTLIAPQVTSLLILAFNEVYVQRPLSYYFQSPYDEIVMSLHDKSRTNAEIIAGLPSGQTNVLYTDEFLASFRGDGEQQLKAALASNDLHSGWQPVTPLRFFHGALDSIVPLIQSQAALAGLTSNHLDAELVVIENAEHLQTIVPATLQTIQWFDQILAEQ